MGKRSKERNMVASATRRRPKLEINRVSRHEVADAPPKPTQGPLINPNSITGIGLLGSYGNDTDEEEEEEEIDTGQNVTDANVDSKPKDEIDNQLADFFKEIQSMESNTNHTNQSEETADKELENEYDTKQADDDNQGQQDPNYPWQACLDSNSNSYYFWNMETNEVQWEPPMGFQFHSTVSNDDNDEEYSRTSFEQDGIFSNDRDDDGDGNEDRQDDDDDDENHSITCDQAESNNGFDNSSNVNLDGIPLDEIRDETNEEDKEEEADVSKTETKKREAEKDDEDAEQTTKKAKFTTESVDDFADQLLEDTYDQGQRDIHDEENMEMSEDEENSRQSDGNLLPPEAFPDDDSNTETEEIKAPVDDTRPGYTQAEEEEYRVKIIDRSALLNNKLAFLNISTKDISNLHVICIEMEARIRDWREGALDSRHLVKKLKEADEHLKKYEESAAPPGWSCHWDRKYKRYFYTNNETNESQWDYPSDEILEDKETSNTASTPAVSIATTGVTMATAGTTITTPTVTMAMTPATMATAHPLAAHAWSVALPVQVPMVPMVMATNSLATAMQTTASQHYYTPAVASTTQYYTPSALGTDTCEPPPPPPGTDDDPPPLPPGESEPPPPPPPGAPPEEAPPPPPPEDDSVNTPLFPIVSSSLFKAAAGHESRQLLDYSDLDTPADSPNSVPVDVAVPAIPQIGTASSIPQAQTIKTGKKKKKTKSSLFGSTLSSKVRKVSSLVQKWQTIEQQVQQPDIMDSSESEDEDQDMTNARMIEEWKQSQLESGKAAYNPNFEEVKGDWRERLKKKT